MQSPDVSFFFSGGSMFNLRRCTHLYTFVELSFAPTVFPTKTPPKTSQLMSSEPTYPLPCGTFGDPSSPGGIWMIWTCSLEGSHHLVLQERAGTTHTTTPVEVKSLQNLVDEDSLPRWWCRICVILPPFFLGKFDPI